MDTPGQAATAFHITTDRKSRHLVSCMVWRLRVCVHVTTRSDAEKGEESPLPRSKGFITEMREVSFSRQSQRSPRSIILDTWLFISPGLLSSSAVCSAVHLHLEVEGHSLEDSHLHVLDWELNQKKGFINQGWWTLGSTELQLSWTSCPASSLFWALICLRDDKQAL